MSETFPSRTEAFAHAALRRWHLHGYVEGQGQVALDHENRQAYVLRKVGYDRVQWETA